MTLMSLSRTCNLVSLWKDIDDEIQRWQKSVSLHFHRKVWGKKIQIQIKPTFK